MSKIVELRQDRALMRPNFDGYKLSLEPVPVIRQDLTSAPLKAEPSDEQYSLLHVELFSMQNLLIVDPWSRTESYYINRKGDVVRVSYDENKGSPNPMHIVYRMNQEENDDSTPIWKCKGQYNTTFRFISEKFCVLCDGNKRLFLFETGNRSKAQEWQVVATTNIYGSDIELEERGYVIFDARLDILQEQKQISLALGHVQRVDSSQARSSSTHYMYIHWAKWILKDQQWQLEIVDTLECKGSIYYCAFEPRSQSLILSSNRPCIWRSAKTNKHTEGEPLAEMAQLHEGDEEDRTEISSYSWSQTDDDILVKFNVKPGMDKNNYHIKCVSNRITVKCNDETLLDNELKEKIDHDLTTWTIENNFLQITLVKQDSDMYWSSLLANDLGPKENTENNTQQNCLPLEQQPIANLEAPIEDCDFPMGIEEDEITISRFNLPTKSITHSVIMGSNPPLFTTSLRPGFPLAIATRQDVDCSLWLQQYNVTKPDEWSLRHEGNLHAFGYIQASKQQKKFMDCSPDLGYAIISESHRHIFLYKSKYDTANGLRNRNGPQVTIGKQHLVTLDDAGEVLGLCTANSTATLLTEKFIMFIQIES
ncbi:nudC domain-containing protein 1 [Stomoxys calcitrans]|uniref:nudC domain-containing protein 1 n=1 Tax=Stomoxys calcitrans TaxID=35570 RepID=UPI0027E2FDD2|nr:nudC domain-containing protein 1 [Stomoxys calcitrans]